MLGYTRGFVHRRLIREGIPRRPVTCGNEARVEVICEICDDRVLRRAYLVRRAAHQLCGRPACRAICRMVYAPLTMMVMLRWR